MICNLKMELINIFRDREPIYGIESPTVIRVTKSEIDCIAREKREEVQNFLKHLQS